MQSSGTMVEYCIGRVVEHGVMGVLVSSQPVIELFEYE